MPVSEADCQAPRLLERADHPISRSKIASNALKVLYRLHRSGFKSYLVGGSVRDLLLRREPKDFDVGTDARPAQIRRLFRNSRIIGRRFRLAHIFFSEGIVEVATFRREPSPEEQKGGPDELLITSDNAFGSPRQDAFRRDFTINALFYDISNFSVIDYVGGIDDLEAQMVRCIGEPCTRFREDPVRMLRACEFAARLGFGIEQKTQEAILECREELDKASSARMTEELVQLLKCGHAGSAVQWMLDLGLVDVFIPEVHQMLSPRDDQMQDLHRMLPVVDSMIGEGALLSDAVVLAVLLLPKALLERLRIENRNRRPMRRAALEALVREISEPFLDRFSLSNAKAGGVIHAMLGFQRLCEPRWTPAQREHFARRRSFLDAMSLFEIMVRATGEGPTGAGALAAGERTRPGDVGREKERASPPSSPTPSSSTVPKPFTIATRERMIALTGANDLFDPIADFESLEEEIRGSAVFEPNQG